MLMRPLPRYPGADYLLLLSDPTGTVTCASHHGRQLDARQAQAQAQALRHAHPWEPSGRAEALAG